MTSSGRLVSWPKMTANSVTLGTRLPKVKGATSAEMHMQGTECHNCTTKIITKKYIKFNSGFFFFWQYLFLP